MGSEYTLSELQADVVAYGLHGDLTWAAICVRRAGESRREGDYSRAWEHMRMARAIVARIERRRGVRS